MMSEGENSHYHIRTTSESGYSNFPPYKNMSNKKKLEQNFII